MGYIYIYIYIHTPSSTAFYSKFAKKGHAEGIFMSWGRRDKPFLPWLQQYMYMANEPFYINQWNDNHSYPMRTLSIHQSSKRALCQIRYNAMPCTAFHCIKLIYRHSTFTITISWKRDTTLSNFVEKHASHTTNDGDYLDWPLIIKPPGTGERNSQCMIG